MNLRPKLARRATAALIAALIAGFASGPVEIQAARSPGFHVDSSPISGRPAALTPKLTVSPTSAVINEWIVLSGENFSSVSVSGGPGPSGTHQITGSGVSIVTMGGNILQSPYISYPIEIDSGGRWFANVILQGNSSTYGASSLQFVAKDSGGASASASLTVKKRTISLDEKESRIGTKVKINGTGFPRANTTSPDNYRVKIEYGSTNLTSVAPDSSGEFEATIQVPNSALIPSSNTVTASIIGTTATATATHSVPGASIAISPTEGPSGTTVTVTGSNFRAFRTISNLTIGVASVDLGSSNTTDKDGSFTVTSVVPQLPVRVNAVVVAIGVVRSITSFKVTEPDIPPTPTLAPTPTPAPSVTPDAGLAPLIVDENLVRVWHFDPASQEIPPGFGWGLYDPRPIFALANTVTQLTTGKFYWMSVKENRTVTLNGKERVLFAGWNPLSW